MKRWMFAVLYLVYLIVFWSFNSVIIRTVESVAFSENLYLVYFVIMFGPPFALILMSNYAADSILIIFNTVVAAILNNGSESDAFFLCVVGILGSSMGVMYFRSFKAVFGTDQIRIYTKLNEFERDLLDLQKKFYACIAILVTLTISIVVFGSGKGFEFKQFLVVGVVVFILRMKKQHETMQSKHIGENARYES